MKKQEKVSLGRDNSFFNLLIPVTKEHLSIYLDDPVIPHQAAFGPLAASTLGGKIKALTKLPAPTSPTYVFIRIKQPNLKNIHNQYMSLNMQL